MAYRRRQGITRASTFKEEIHHDHSLSSSSPSVLPSSHSFSNSSSLAAQAIRASAAHRESSLGKGLGSIGEGSTLSESKSGFWGVLARKAKAILEDDVASQEYGTATKKIPNSDASALDQHQQPFHSIDNMGKMENRKFRKGLDAITTSLNHLGDTFEKAFEEGRTIVESKTADIKLQIKRKGNNSDGSFHSPNANTTWQQPLLQTTQPQNQNNNETQLKASRDVAMATAAKAKLLLRELKTIKADLAFAKERCSQLEEENKILRENRDKRDHRADDDLIRLQLETLLAEKARLAHENSVYARENRFLREIVEYHQLTMQDVVYLDEGIEEVTEVYPISGPGVSKMLSISPHSSTSPTSPSEDLLSPSESPTLTKEVSPLHNQPQENSFDVVSENASDVPPTSTISVADEEDNTKRPSTFST
ncbi:uncharacterized protein LOC107431415 [Ziziphus jujuba]|uniref:Uncharacterized protein LOC107431415 n=1 Tax=Ziziphus jujuba TaxID=326968 RepID=A0A6P4AJE3_ZIZJJ|nr:uncharacterized protein LOC107431415 [Ziziphus jujuba]